MQNPMQLMQQFSQFAGNYRGNAEQEARQMLSNANLNQKQLNKIQSMANMVYGMAQRFGMIK